MLILLDRGQDLHRAAEDFGGGYEVGQLLTPLTRRKWLGCQYAIDNGAFAKFNAAGFRSLLARQFMHREECKFVASPDVVGNARRTLELLEVWRAELHQWPVALVLQDGIDSLPIPWAQIAAVFVGGSTHFKCSDSAMDICRAARACGKWVHVGRVNTPQRLDRWLDEADSIDGTGISRYSHMRKAMRDPAPLLRRRHA